MIVGCSYFTLKKLNLVSLISRSSKGTHFFFCLTTQIIYFLNFTCSKNILYPLHTLPNIKKYTKYAIIGLTIV